MNTIIPPQDHAIITFEAGTDWQRLFVTWLAALRSENTRRNYRSAWERLTTFITPADSDPITPDKITAEHLLIWRSALLRDKFNENTVNLSLSAISSFYRFLKKHYPLFAPVNPCANVERLKVDPYGRATFLNTEERQDFRLLNSLASDDSYAGVRDYAIILTLLTTALRVSALVKVTRRGLRSDGEGGKLTYENKGGNTDEKEIHPHTYAAISAYLSRRAVEESYVKKDDPLFLYAGKPITSTHIQRIVQRRCDAVFGKGHAITPHSLRHTAAIITSEEGSFAEVFSLLRHKNTRVTSIYLENINKKRVGAKATRRLDDRYSGT